MTTWKRDFASGLVVITPLLVIVFVIGWVYTQLSSLGVPKITGTPSWLPTEVAQVLVALVVFVLLVFSAGYLMRTTAGRVLEGVIDDTINRVPGLRVVYNASKLAIETALTGTDELQTPVKIEPWPGMRMTAFKTGQTTTDGRETVFLPTAPNITTGFVIEVDPDDITETDERVEEALTRILSAGFGEQDTGVPIDVENAGDGSSPAPTEVDVDVSEAGDQASDGGDRDGDDWA
ncbi:DUF502 domain-containing protein [Halobaculum sp. MBLA0143]|uniref:DUF502 domain-containing protein n=1 Tax=Halobaculum sp. MBLA0143 TaxID=3079933 RepID=UPI0035246DF3